MNRLFVVFLILTVTFCKVDFNEKPKKDVLDSWMETLLILSYPYLIDTCAVTPVFRSGSIPPISQGYGARGTHTVSVAALPNPSAPRNVCVYYPSDQKTKAPVLFLIHGFSSPSAEAYYPLIGV